MFNMLFITQDATYAILVPPLFLSPREQRGSKASSAFTCKEAQSTSDKKKKGWKLKFPTRKNKNSINTEPPQQEVPVTPPQYSPETAAATLQMETRDFLLHKVFQNINAAAMLEKSGVMVDSDELTVKNIKFSEIQQNWVCEAGNSMEEAPSDSTSVTTLRENDKIMEIIDWDSDEEEMSDIVIECDESAVRNTNLLKTEENKIAKAVNLIEEPVFDGLETEGARGDTMETDNLDPYDVPKSSDAMMMFNKSKNQNPNFEQKDGVSSTEEAKIERMALTETRGMNELEKTSNADQELTEKEISSSNPTEEKETRGLKKVLEKISAENKEMKTQMAELCAQQSQLVNWLQGIGLAVERIEKRDEMSITSFERRSDSFN